jgi:serine protease AprX
MVATAVSCSFNLSATPSTQQVMPGVGTSYAVNLTRTAGTCDVSLNLTGLPAGAAGSFSPNPLTGATASSTLSITTGSSTPVGNITLGISGTATGAPTATAFPTLVVVAPLTANPNFVEVPQGQTTNPGYAISIARSGGFLGNVTFSATGLPADATAVFTPNPASGDTANLAVITAGTTPTGTYSLTLTGTSGSQTGSTSTSLRVLSPADCSSGGCDLDQ